MRGPFSLDLDVPGRRPRKLANQLETDQTICTLACRVLQQRIHQLLRAPINLQSAKMGWNDA
jgi:hypothetical protein